jgi:DNA-binding HxlR family transcriptional regulator
VSSRGTDLSGTVCHAGPLERDGLITRTIYAEVPARVEYELTALGHTLLELIAASQRWAEDHMPTLLAARDAYENHNTGMG